MPLTIRAPRPGDGTGMARVWLSAAAYYAGLDARHFQIPPAEGVAESFEAGLGPGGEDELMLVADLDGQVAGWLTARIEHPAPGAARQLVREPGWTRLHIDATSANYHRSRAPPAAARASAAADRVRAASSDPTRGCSAKARSASAAEPVRAAAAMALSQLFTVLIRPSS